MCKNCPKDCKKDNATDSQLKGSFALARTKPKQLMDMKPAWMCSIVGTCLSLAELKKLQRRNKILAYEGDMTDYNLHGFFVKAASTERKISKAMHNLLVRKYRLTWKKFAMASNIEELTAMWDQSLADGDVAGPYWAVLAHPLTDLKLEERVYGEVHMLSHLVGSTNRADLKAMRKNEIDNNRLKEELEQMRCDIWSRDRIIAGLRSDLEEQQRNERNKLFSSQNYDNKSLMSLASVVEGLRKSLESADKTNQGLQDAVARKAKRIEQLELERERLKQDLALVEAESHILENATPSFLGQSCANDGGTCVGEDNCPYDLCHKRVLYVGGRTQLVSRYRDVVESWNGEFLHHDGGQQQSFARLGGLLEQADIVVFPADCVSHSAVDHIKTQCRQSGKPMMPVRTAGLGSFMSGLQDIAKQGESIN